MKVASSRILAVLAVLSLASIVGAADDLVLKPGFRDMRLGDAVSKLAGAKCEPRKKLGTSHWQSCERPGDHLAIGDAKLTGVVYAFLDDQLWYVVFSAMEQNCKELASTIRNVYGEPTWDKSGRSYYGMRTSFHIGYNDGSTELLCVDQPDNQTCGCDIRSQKLQRKYIEMKRNEAAGDL